VFKIVIGVENHTALQCPPVVANPALRKSSARSFSIPLPIGNRQLAAAKPLPQPGRQFLTPDHA
jgi:hypothetical protein